MVQTADKRAWDMIPEAKRSALEATKCNFMGGLKLRCTVNPCRWY
jgi:hypothetical protein